MEMHTVEELRVLMIPKKFWQDIKNAALLGKSYISIPKGSYERSFDELLLWIPCLEERGFLVKPYGESIHVYWSFVK